MTNQNEPMQNMQVHCTKDLSIFKIMTGNRVPNINHIKRLEVSIEENGMLINPIIVNEKYEVVDGQHRLMAAKNKESSIYYIVAQGYTLADVHALNQNQKNWTSMDFINGYADMGYADYIWLRDFIFRHPDFTPTSSVAICGQKQDKVNRSISHGKVAKYSQAISAGNWVMGSKVLAEDYALKIKQVKPYYAGYNRKSFILVMVSLFKKKEFNFKEFLGKLKLRPISLVDCGSNSQYRQLIEDIYNYRRQNKVNLRF